MSKQRVLSGMRPSGKLHLGNLVGALENWKKLQEDYDCFFFAADWHALTTEYNSTESIQESIREMTTDWLSVGLSPEKCVLFVQSRIKEHAELHLLLSMITPLAWLERVPTYKEQQQEITNRDLSTYGFLGYPLLQTADIIIYKAHKVPVGIDQVPHVELSREITRRFNFLYAPVFPHPEPMLTEVPKVLGIDGRKMSKSYDNAIYISDPPQEIRQKVAQMFTDPNRIKRGDPGNPDICNVFAFHRVYSSPEAVEQVRVDCRRGAIGCVEDKKNLAENIVAYLTPIHEQRSRYLQNPCLVDEVLEDGCQRARLVASRTMEEVRAAMKIT
ncbi:MAG: tryptophan--tRNA ligase [Deltaproteobacteria bacterium]|nr:tryptophan--tRNA ligase [Deltaproteobacteria bacterium]